MCSKRKIRRQALTSVANPNPVFFATVKDSKILFDNKPLLEMYISSMEGKNVDIIIRPHKKDRSHNQNKYYWVAVVGIPAKHYGYLPEEMHDALKLMFLPKNEEGKPRTIRSTTTLSTVEFMEYVERCRQCAAEQGLFIPDPQTVE